MELIPQYKAPASKSNLKLEKISPRIYDPITKIDIMKLDGKQYRRVAERTIVSLAGRGKHYVAGLAEDIVNTGLDALRGRKKGRTLKLIEDGLPVIEEAPFVNMLGYEVRDYLALSAIVPEIRNTGITSETSVDQQFVDFHAVMKVSEKKNILMTQVQGRDRSRKEYISGGDLMVSISGKITHKKPDIYPADEVSKLYSILKSRDVVSCDSPFLTMFGITGLVILDFDFPQNVAFRNVQTYTINAVFEPGVPILLVEQQQTKTKLEKELKRKTGWMSITDRVKNDAINFVTGAVENVIGGDVEIQI